ncbi:sialidase family protein [Virgibacillus halophilus]|uniref:exo-alpha-sialidase n=1 Tax=Tigheibacillus halophilus TaxID=361280 RepID=A0ABU5C5G7_9BACI|nr:sialidase family protein [Virgibacillus halophilus]
MVLYDKDEQEYTIRKDGVVYDQDGQKTGYTVDEKRNLYQDGSKISNIFVDESPLKPLKTSYLELWHSDDEGKTWDGPMNLNDAVKEEWMAFLGAGPGTGIQMKNGPHKGRLVYPIYFTNENNAQASAVIYSDDNGKTWRRGESPNEGRIVDGEVLNERTFTGSSNELTESQVVEMPDGQLKLFMRNYSGYAQIATSFNGGETWDAEVVTEHGLVAPYSQMTAIRYNGQIDNQEAVIFASAGDSSSRVNGTVKAGLIKEDGTYPNGRIQYKFDWKYSQLVKEGAYGYSSLTNLDHGNIGLLYENDTNMDFIQFNPAFLKWEKEGEFPAPALKSISIVQGKEESYLPGDSIRVQVKFADYVMLSGDRSLLGDIDGQQVVLHLVETNTSGTAFVFEGKVPELQAGKYELNASFSNDLKIRNVYGQELDASGEANKLSEKISINQKVTASSIKELVADMEEAGEIKEAQDAHLFEMHLTAVEQYEKKDMHKKSSETYGRFSTVT